MVTRFIDWLVKVIDGGVTDDSDPARCIIWGL
jgi:hypothetical protein